MIGEGFGLCFYCLFILISKEQYEYFKSTYNCSGAKHHRDSAYLRIAKEHELLRYRNGSSVTWKAILLVFVYLNERANGKCCRHHVLYRDIVWFESFNIHYAIGVDGISVSLFY